jgi:hypothetical protein
MPATVQTLAAERTEAERRVATELESWRTRTLPDPRAPLDADDLARLVRSCLDALGVGEAGAEFSVNTVHYYRRKDILDAPAGRTSSARYDVRHVWQAVGARLAGHLGLVTLAEARAVMRARRLRGGSHSRRPRETSAQGGRRASRATRRRSGTSLRGSRDTGRTPASGSNRGHAIRTSVGDRAARRRVLPLAGHARRPRVAGRREGTRARTRPRARR